MKLSFDFSQWGTPRTNPGTAWQQFQKRGESKQVGFFDWPLNAEADLKKSYSLAHYLTERFDGALIFGIGGSYLGPFALSTALKEKARPFPIHWVNNTDGPSLREAGAFASQYRCASIVISKSGGTTETLSAFFHLSSQLDPSGYVLITDPMSGELRRLAEENQWHSLPVPPNIGGRFSVLTAVGLLPFALQGFQVGEFLEGARDMRTEILKGPETHPVFQYAQLCHQSFEEGKNIHCLMPYESRLRPLADWYVQLWAESLGKNKKGFTPMGALGTSDQHSVLQLFREGPLDKVVGFLEVASTANETQIQKPFFRSPAFEYLNRHSFEEVTRKASVATQRSLANGKTPTYRITFPEVNERTLGAFIFFMETSCGIAGELFGVDAFDQPGVEEAKRLLRASLE